MSNIQKGSGLIYTTGIPNTIPVQGTDSEFAIDVNGNQYAWNRNNSVWDNLGQAIEIATSSGVPTHTPTKFRPRFVVTPDRNFYFYSGSWGKVGTLPSGLISSSAQIGPTGIYSGSGTVPSGTRATGQFGDGDSVQTRLTFGDKSYYQDNFADGFSTFGFETIDVTDTTGFIGFESEDGEETHPIIRSALATGDRSQIRVTPAHIFIESPVFELNPTFNGFNSTFIVQPSYLSGDDNKFIGFYNSNHSYFGSFKNDSNASEFAIGGTFVGADRATRIVISENGQYVRAGWNGLESSLNVYDGRIDLRSEQNDGKYSIIEMSSSGLFVEGFGTFRGIQYRGNYTGSFTSGSLVDKRYVDANIHKAFTPITITGVTGSLIASGTFSPSINRITCPGGDYVSITVNIENEGNFRDGQEIEFVGLNALTTTLVFNFSIFYSPSNLDLYKNTGIKIVKFAWSTNFAAWIIVNYIDE